MNFGFGLLETHQSVYTGIRIWLGCVISGLSSRAVCLVCESLTAVFGLCLML